MAPASFLRSTVFRRAAGVVALLAGVAAVVIGAVGWHANATLTRATSSAIESDLGELRNVFRQRGLDGLAAVVAERSLVRGRTLYRLEDEAGQMRAGNVAATVPGLATGFRTGTFRYRAFDAADRALPTAAGVVVDIDGHSRLFVGRDIEEQRALLAAIYRSVGLGTVLLLLTGLIGSLILSRHILARIEAMSRASGAIMAGNLSGRIPVDGSADELDRLAGHLNAMLGRIEQLMDGMREVSDNIAHDLRTPLNRLRNNAEQALADARGGEAWHAGLERVIDEADELIKTFNALLLIARLEAGALVDSFEALDLAELVRDVAELYEPAAEEAGFRLESDTQGPLLALAHRQLIGQAVSNLIDNAIKYGRASGSGVADRCIEVAVRREGDTALLIVADRGPGIAAEDRERALRRFIRLEQSRSLPGTGLGLSLVAAVARLHSGSIRLEDNRPGLRVVLAIPLAVVQPASAGMTGAAPPREPEPIAKETAQA